MNSPVDDNPYSSPQHGENHVDGHFRKSVTIGVREQHSLRAEFSLLTGREQYFVDDHLALSTHSLWGRRRILLGEQEQHSVFVHVRFYGRVELSVDSVLLNGDWFPLVRQITQTGIALIAVGLLALMAGYFPVVNKLLFTLLGP